MSIQKDQLRLQPWMATLLAWIILFVSGALIWGLSADRLNPKHPIPQSFEVFLKARDRLAQLKNPYVLGASSLNDYSPGFLLALRVLPEDHQAAWTVYSISALVLVLLSVGLAGRPWTFGSLIPLLFGIGLSWSGLRESVDYGQLELLILAASLAGATAFRVHPVLSGFLIGTLPWIRITWLILAIPFFILANRRGYRTLTSFMAGFFSSGFFWGAVIPSVTLGADRAKEFSQQWVHLIRGRPESLYLSPYNQSLFAGALRWFGDDHQMLYLGLMAVVGGWLLGRLSARTPNLSYHQNALVWTSPWLLLNLLIMPLSWQWSSAFLIGAGVSAYRGGGLVTNKWILFICGVALLAIQLIPWGPLVPYHALTWLGALMLCL